MPDRTVIEELERLLKEGGRDLPWEIDDPANGYMRIMGQPDGDADDYGRPVVTWPHIADIIDAGDYDKVAELIVTAVNRLPALIECARALQAFSSHADWQEGADTDAPDLDGHSLIIGDFRRARQALAALEGPRA